jgi:predicted metal-dependent phosphoesterase TrpH
VVRDNSSTLTTPIDLELHSHTHYSPDSLSKLPEVIEHCRKIGIHKIAITDHYEIEGALIAQQMAPDLIIVGEEALTPEGELLCYFIKELIPQGIPLDEAIDRVHDQGGICGPSHPCDPRRYGIGATNLYNYAHKLDFVEVFNARTRDPKKNDEALAIATELGLPKIVASDAHTLQETGISRVRLHRPFTSPQDFLAALREPETELITHASDYRANLSSRIAAVVHGLGFDKK